MTWVWRAVHPGRPCSTSRYIINHLKTGELEITNSLHLHFWSKQKVMSTLSKHDPLLPIHPSAKQARQVLLEPNNARHQHNQYTNAYFIGLTWIIWNNLPVLTCLCAHPPHLTFHRLAQTWRKTQTHAVLVVPWLIQELATTKIFNMQTRCYTTFSLYYCISVHTW